jgi:hypothetical protein
LQANVLCRNGVVFAQQVGHRAGFEPVAAKPPPRLEEPKKKGSFVGE